MLLALHLPDHAVSAEVTVAGAVVALLFVAGTVWSLIRRRHAASEGRTSGPAVIGAVAALVFAVQMFNFPLLDGVTSGHVLGATLAVVLLGPALGGLVMAGVLAVQALLLGDGGLSALGCNTVNMAAAATLASMLVYRVVAGRRTDLTRRCLAASIAGWAGSMAAAVACAAELAVSNVAPASEVFSSLVAHHAVLGLVEGLFTAAVVAVAARSTSERPVWVARFAPIAAMAVIAAVVVPFSSSRPDGLEHALETTARQVAK